ncbi:hypothetical protein [Candidatus Binatus sp.]
MEKQPVASGCEDNDFADAHATLAEERSPLVEARFFLIATAAAS